MKKLAPLPWRPLLASVALLAGVVLLGSCKETSGNPADEALQVIERWAAAFTASNVDAITSLYAPDATFFGTGSKQLVATPEQVRSYFETGLNRDRPRGAELLDRTVQVVSDDVVIVTGRDRVSGTKDNNVYFADGRVTFVLQKRASTWQIVHFHRSVLPPG